MGHDFKVSPPTEIKESERPINRQYKDAAEDVASVRVERVTEEPLGVSGGLEIGQLMAIERQRPVVPRIDEGDERRPGNGLTGDPGSKTRRVVEEHTGGLSRETSSRC